MGKSFTLILIIVIVSSIIMAVTSYLQLTQKQYVKVICNYMMYACGDCYPQYNVKEIISGNSELKIVGQDINIEFDNPKAEKQFNEKTPICVICLDYYLSGQIRYSLWKGNYILNVSNYSIILPDSTCCSTPYFEDDPN